MRTRLPSTKSLRPLLLLPALLCLGGCQTLQTITHIGATERTRELILDFYCGVDGKPGAYVPVALSHRDTPETISQTVANNAVYDKLCPKDQTAK